MTPTGFDANRRPSDNRGMSSSGPKTAKPKGKGKISPSTRERAMIEAGYRCAVPTCRSSLSLDVHHITQKSEGGTDEIENLIVLCPTCHAAFHRGTYSKEAIRVWKITLLQLNNSYDRNAVNLLLLLDLLIFPPFTVTADALLPFAPLITSGLVNVTPKLFTSPATQMSGLNVHHQYMVQLSEAGQAFMKAWKDGKTQS
jgi:5-methylcytosine-specific restriction endonuclease McrA